MRLPAALITALLLTACTPTTEHESVGVPPLTVSAVPSPTPTFEVKDVQDDFFSFSSPSKNIGCAMGDNGDGTGWARCDIREHAWTLPPRPKDCVDSDWGAGVSVGSRSSRGTVGICASDAAGGGAALAYGHGARMAGVECRSATEGVTCEVLATQHGFFVSRASYRVF